MDFPRKDRGKRLYILVDNVAEDVPWKTTGAVDVSSENSILRGYNPLLI